MVGFIIAIVLHGQKKTLLGAYHLRQASGLIVTGSGLAVIGFIITLVTLGSGAFLLPLIWILLLVMVIMGIVNAANGQEKPVVILGKNYEQWFANAFTSTGVQPLTETFLPRPLTAPLVSVAVDVKR